MLSFMVYHQPHRFKKLQPYSISLFLGDGFSCVVPGPLARRLFLPWRAVTAALWAYQPCNGNTGAFLHRKLGSSSSERWKNSLPALVKTCWCCQQRDTRAHLGVPEVYVLPEGARGCPGTETWPRAAGG